MADVRALLKAKRQEARITHPYAAYGGAGGGALRCTACGVAVKFASAWEGHVGSKAHRAVVAGLKAKEEEAGAAARASSALLSKRKAEEQGGDDDRDEDEGGGGDGDEDEGMEPQRPPPGKRQRTEERESGADAQTQGQGQGQTQRGAFPMDFFSDPSRAPPTSDRGPHDDDDEMDQDQDQEGSATKTAAAAAPKSQLEMEWAAFERDMQSLPRRRPSQGRAAPPGEDGAEAEGAAAAAEVVADPREAYARATIAAEPELVPKFEGLPMSGARMEDEGETPREGGGEERKVSEGDERKRKEREERELIMDRLLEEERAQEDAYNRVALLKNRVQMLKQKRELAKAKGKKADTTDTQT
jgi:zinc finger protein 830